MREIRPLSSLRQTAKKRKPGYLEACLRLGKLDEATQMVHFTAEAWLKLRQKFGQAKPVVIQGFTKPGFMLGDKIAGVATPIARALGLDCIDKATGQLKPESGCNQRRLTLNKLTSG